MVETNLYFPMLSVSGNSRTGTGCDVRSLLQGSKGYQEMPTVPRSPIYVNSMPIFSIGSYFPLPEALYGFQNKLDPCTTVEWKVHIFQYNPLLGRKLQHMTEQT